MKIANDFLNPHEPPMTGSMVNPTIVASTLMGVESAANGLLVSLGEGYYTISDAQLILAEMQETLASLVSVTVR